MTHDQVEALALADRVAVMDQGRIVQEGAPGEIYDRPKICSSRASSAPRTCSRAGSRSATARAGRALRSPAEISTDAGHGARAGRLRSTWSCARKISDRGATAADALNAIPGRIVALTFQGSNVEYDVDIGGGSSLRVLARAQAELTRGTPVWVGIDTRHVAGVRQLIARGPASLLRPR